MEHLIEMLGRDTGHRFGLADLPDTLRTLGALGHVDGHAQSGRTGALADARLEHPQLALFDGELGVAHVLVVRLETGEDLQEFGVDLRELRGERVEVLGVANTRDHVFALRVHEEVAVRNVLTGGGVAREADTRARVVVAVAEDHGLNVDGGAEVVRDLLADAVGDGACSVPALEHCFDRAAQLGLGLLRERLAGLTLHDIEIRAAEILEHRRRGAA